MNPVRSAIMVPHPPIILPNIGKGEEKAIADIDTAYRQAAKEIADAKPDTVILLSPHAPAYLDYIQISDGRHARGDMGQFRDYADKFDIAYDQKLIREIDELCQLENIPAGTLGQQDGRLDHGTMIPLWYLKEAGIPDTTQYIRIGTGGPNSLTHYRLGQLVTQAAQNLGRTIAVIASGDLSHCQKAGTHYGFKPEGPAYDKKIMDIMGKADFDRLLEISDKEADDAMVCGQKPFCILAGTLDQTRPETKELAHSAQFGVGYGVCTYTGIKEDPNRDFGQQAKQKKEQQRRAKLAAEDPYVRLARQTIEQYIRTGHVQPTHFVDGDPAGAFVSIHKDGSLRGCIGTTSPTKPTLLQEIMANAISASTQDPRFPAIQPWELDDLDINVDILQPAEKVQDKNELDPHQYGVIVTKGNKRGLLLPDLEGVDTVEDQLNIACSKAGIDPDTPYTIEKFTVTRHS